MTKNWLDFGDLDQIFKVTAVEKKNPENSGGGHLFSLKTLLLVKLNTVCDKVFAVRLEKTIYLVQKYKWIYPGNVIITKYSFPEAPK